MTPIRLLPGGQMDVQMAKENPEHAENWDQVPKDPDDYRDQGGGVEGRGIKIILWLTQPPTTKGHSFHVIFMDYNILSWICEGTSFENFFGSL